MTGSTPPLDCQECFGSIRSSQSATDSRRVADSANRGGSHAGQGIRRSDRGIWLYRQVHNPAAVGDGSRGQDAHGASGAGGVLQRHVEVAPLQFDRPEELVESLRGASTFYNTYWVRFPHGEVTYEQAVENTRILIEAAREAGVRRIVHLSITNPSPDSR